jgi:hypothetical protein
MRSEYGVAQLREDISQILDAMQRIPEVIPEMKNISRQIQ